MKKFYELFQLVEACDFSQANLRHVQDLEKKIYPPNLQVYQDDEDDWRASLEQFLDFVDCEDELECIIQPTWYAIFCNRAETVEIIDLASVRKLQFGDFSILYKKLLSFGDKVFEMNARLDTSYPMIKSAEKRGYLKILVDEPTVVFGEPMREIEFILLGKILKEKSVINKSSANQISGFQEWMNFRKINR